MDAESERVRKHNEIVEERFWEISKLVIGAIATSTLGLFMSWWRGRNHSRDVSIIKAQVRDVGDDIAEVKNHTDGMIVEIKDLALELGRQVGRAEQKANIVDKQ